MQLFFGTSVLGTIFYGYFFAFHFLNIVYNNELLQRVIKAITLNGTWNFVCCCCKKTGFFRICHRWQPYLTQKGQSKDDVKKWVLRILILQKRVDMDTFSPT